MEELELILETSEERMAKTIEALKESLRSIRTGRATPGLLDGVLVSYYGTPTPINQVANISAPEASLLLVQPYDKGSIKDIEKGIIAADIGLNPNNDGDVIRIPIPQLTEDRRKELVKQAKKIAEEFKVQIRNLRRDGNDDLKKLEKGSVSEDVIISGIDQIQKKTYEMIKEIDVILTNKEASIMEI
ncbi:ribosome recycling factor [endosymbiont 'TC1' of Trimyema compressum]|uniref:ribosome recycling factor n=1 Tax=endosymbiont 'TC1' of Trimyema compressum TaxID=243899 RepID=UPI0007F1387C|nr:ribosome recycling factor [endosymbiont 'TC1' of Trimyema compressum]AMP20151.1 ribosome recycling factor [endosymbiont 'TC1' of Trimyema compressum]